MLNREGVLRSRNDGFSDETLQVTMSPSNEPPREDGEISYHLSRELRCVRRWKRARGDCGLEVLRAHKSRDFMQVMKLDEEEACP